MDGLDQLVTLETPKKGSSSNALTDHSRTLLSQSDSIKICQLMSGQSELTEQSVFKKASFAAQQQQTEKEKELSRTFNQQLEAKNYKGAEQTMLGLLKERQAVYGEDSQQVAVSYSYLGLACNRDGRYADAKKYYQQAVATSKACPELGPEAAFTALNTANIAHMDGSLGNLNGAAANYKEAIRIYRLHDPLNHPEVTQVMIGAVKDYAEVLGKLGKPQEAQQQRDEANYLTKQLGLVDRASRLIAINDFKGGEKVLLDLLKEQRAHYGENSPEACQTLNHLAGLCQFDGRLADARDYYSKAAAVAKIAHGPESFLAGVNIQNMANMEGNLGKWNEAITHYQEALRIFEKNKPLENKEVADETIATLRDYAEALKQTGKPEEAQKQLDRAEEIRKAHQGAPKRNRVA